MIEITPNLFCIITCATFYLIQQANMSNFGIYRDNECYFIFKLVCKQIDWQLLNQSVTDSYANYRSKMIQGIEVNPCKGNVLS